MEGVGGWRGEVFSPISRGRYSTGGTLARAVHLQVRHRQEYWRHDPSLPAEGWRNIEDHAARASAYNDGWVCECRDEEKTSRQFEASASSQVVRPNISAPAAGHVKSDAYFARFLPRLWQSISSPVVFKARVRLSPGGGACVVVELGVNDASHGGLQTS